MARSVSAGMVDDLDRDEDTGRWRAKFSPEAVLQVVADTDGPVTSGDVREALDCSYDTARRRLSDLEDAGKLEKQTIAGTAVYTIADEDE